MKKLQINFMNNLRNYEFADLYLKLCAITEDELLDEPHAKMACKAMKTHVNDIDYIDIDSRSHDLTSIIGEQVRNRTDYLTSLHLQLKGLKLSFCADERTAAQLLSNWLHQQGKLLFKPSINIQTRLVDNLMHTLQLNDELEKAIIFLRLDRHLAAIADINIAINSNFIRRNNEMSERTKKSRLIRKAAYRDLKIFVNILNFFVDMDTNNDENSIYLQYSNRMNILLTHYHTILKSRTTKRKNKKEIASAVKELICSQQEPENTLKEVLDSELEHGIININPIDDLKQERNDSSSINKRKGKKGDNGELPPINRN